MIILLFGNNFDFFMKLFVCHIFIEALLYMRPSCFLSRCTICQVTFKRIIYNIYRYDFWSTTWLFVIARFNLLLCFVSLFIDCRGGCFLWLPVVSSLHHHRCSNNEEFLGRFLSWYIVWMKNLYYIRVMGWFNASDLNYRVVRTRGLN